MIRSILITGSAVTVFLAAICLLVGTTQHFYSCIFAGTLMTFNLGVIVWSLKKLFAKKSVALAVTVIVIKYAALLGIVIMIPIMGGQIDFGFIVGIGSIVPTIAIMAARHYKRSEQHGSF